MCLIEAFLSTKAIQHINADTIWPSFCGRNFQNHLQGNSMQNVIQIQLNLKTSLKMSSAKWRPFSFGDNVLTHSCGDNVALILQRRRFPCCLRQSLQMAVVLQTNIAGSFSRVANCCILLMTLIILYMLFSNICSCLSMFIKIYFPNCKIINKWALL